MADAPFTANDLEARLIREFEYPPSKAALVAAKLAAMDDSVVAEFWHWWQTGDLRSEVKYAGYTVKDLIREFRLQPVAAFSSLDWLRREPERALEVLRRGREQ